MGCLQLGRTPSAGPGTGRLRKGSRPGRLPAGHRRCPAAQCHLAAPPSRGADAGGSLRDREVFRGGAREVHPLFAAAPPLVEASRVLLDLVLSCTSFACVRYVIPIFRRDLGPAPPISDIERTLLVSTPGRPPH